MGDLCFTLRTLGKSSKLLQSKITAKLVAVLKLDSLSVYLFLGLFLEGVFLVLCHDQVFSFKGKLRIHLTGSLCNFFLPKLCRLFGTL